MKYLLYGIGLLCAGCASSDAEHEASRVAKAVRQSQPSSAGRERPATDQIRSRPVDAKSLEEALENVNAALELAYASDFPARIPNWIAMHAALMHGPEGHQQRDDDANLKRAFAQMLNSNTDQDGAFVLRGNNPWPCRTGSRFSQEHHRDQFLNYFSMTGVPLDAELTVDKRRFTVRDLLEQSLAEARPAGELAFAVSAYAYYLEGDRRWSNKFGESMSLAHLVERLLRTPESSCAGMHRLGGLARVLSRPELRRSRDLAVLFPEIESEINRHIARMKEQQQPDGSFTLAPDMAESYEAQKKRNRDQFDVFCTGHTLEWLSFILEKDEFREEWVVRAADRLASAVRDTCRTTIVELTFGGSEEAHYRFGQLAHAVSGLRRWRDEIVVRDD